MKKIHKILSFDDYFFSRNLSEYERDRTAGVKLLTRRINQCSHSLSTTNIYKLINCLLYMRNVFDKGSILEYIAEYFKFSFPCEITRVIYMVLIERDEGIILNWERYLLNIKVFDRVIENHDKKSQLSNGNINTIVEKFFRR